MNRVGVSGVTLQAALHDLMGVQCPCGQPKDRRRTFCLPCYRRLPRSLRNRLSGVGKSEFVRSDYTATYTEALTSLGLESPFVSKGSHQ